MKGIEKEYLVGLLVVAITFIVIFLMFLGIWNPFVDSSSKTQDTYAECNKWLTTNPPCKVAEEPKPPEKILENYPALKKAYTISPAGLAAAKLFCQCPN